MKTTLPALLIAISILAGSFIVRPKSNSVTNFLTQLEDATVSDSNSGKSKVGKILSNFMSSASEGLYDGMSSHQEKQLKEDKEKLSASQNIQILDVKIVKGGQKNKESVIGRIKSSHALPIKDINLNVMFLDDSDNLLDVSDSFSQVKGILKPGEELGFNINRNLGDFNDSKEELNKSRSSKAKVSIVELKIINKD